MRARARACVCGFVKKDNITKLSYASFNVDFPVVLLSIVMDLHSIMLCYILFRVFELLMIGSEDETNNDNTGVSGVLVVALWVLRSSFFCNALRGLY